MNSLSNEELEQVNSLSKKISKHNLDKLKTIKKGIEEINKKAKQTGLSPISFASSVVAPSDFNMDEIPKRDSQQHTLSKKVRRPIVRKQNSSTPQEKVKWKGLY